MPWLKQTEGWQGDAEVGRVTGVSSPCAAAGTQLLSLTAPGNPNPTCELGMDSALGKVSRSRDAQNAALAWW